LIYALQDASAKLKLNGFISEHDLAFSVANQLFDVAKSIDVFPNTFMELLMKQCSKSDTDSLKGQLLAKQMVS